MKVNISQLVSSLPAFKELNAMPLRPVVALRVVKAIKFAEKHLADYEAARTKLAGECSVVGADGKPKVENNAYVRSDPAKFQAGMAALLAEDYELPPSVKQIDAGHLTRRFRPESSGRWTGSLLSRLTRRSNRRLPGDIAAWQGFNTMPPEFHVSEETKMLCRTCTGEHGPLFEHLLKHADLAQQQAQHIIREQQSSIEVRDKILAAVKAQSDAFAKHEATDVLEFTGLRTRLDEMIEWRKTWFGRKGIGAVLLSGLIYFGYDAIIKPKFVKPVAAPATALSSK